jgi:LacI family transcriptional regulator
VKRVAIFVETSLASGRQILEGIASYVHGRNDWEVYQYAGQLGSFSFDIAKDWTGDGAIARITDATMLHCLQARGLPVIDVLGNKSSSSLPVVKCDDTIIGKTIAEDFLEKGYHQLAYYGLKEEPWSLERGSAFEGICSNANAHFNAMYFERSELENLGTEDWLCRTGEWLLGLTKPVGLMIASDQFAPMVFEAARRARIKIPQEISIVSVDNDAPFCSLCNPPLSSLEPDHFRVGFRAAETLNTWMEGCAPKEAIIDIPPGKIHVRQSSCELAVSDSALGAAMRAISQYACRGISVDEVAKAAGVSRSVIQIKFRQQLKRSIGDSILNIKLGRARELLTETDHSIARVAELSGFNSQEYLTYAFRHHLMTTPGKIRRASRGNEYSKVKLPNR